MLEVGNGGMTEDEYRTQVTLWSIQAAPLILGNDVRTMSSSTRSLLLNKEVIAIDQDPLGIQGANRLSRDGTEVWTKRLKDHATAVAVFNRLTTAAAVTIKWSDLGFAGAQEVRDLWSHTDVGRVENAYHLKVPSHGTVLLKVRSYAPMSVGPLVGPAMNMSR
jgi:alpha-galactosidase